MKSDDIRRKFLSFFEKREHAIIPSASLVTADEKEITNATLFNTAGMQPLVPYLLGEPHPRGKRLANSQKCLRTVDIEDVGDNAHATFFEMLGNWSLGDYFKKDAINWSYQFLTSREEGLGLDPSRLYVTVFEGDNNAPRDDEAAQIWTEIFDNENITRKDEDSSLGRIFYMPASSNWWQAGENGPCGPDSEMYYDVSGRFKGRPITKEEFLDADSKREIVEVWNDVFMQYEKKDGNITGRISMPSIDTGAGLERLAMTMQGVDNIYDTDLFSGVMKAITDTSMGGHIREKRIIADHIRASTFLMADGVLPANTDRGYVLRRLLRRTIRYADVIKLSIPLPGLARMFAEKYSNIYPELSAKIDHISSEIHTETERFRKTLDMGLKEFNKLAGETISGRDAFRLFSTYGLPIDMTQDLAKEKGKSVDTKAFDLEFRKHQELSRSGAEHKFKGGLADASDPMIVRYHTATHLLHQALHDVLGEGVMQKGSNITAERLRFDFTHGAKMTDEEKKKVENIINEKVSAKIPVSQIILPREEAEKTGARHFFAEKYGDKVSIYFIGKASNPPQVSDLITAYSKEFCGGPHVTNTGELAGPEGKWKFKIQKEEAVAQGVRRIKAILV